MKIPTIRQLPSGSWFCQLRIDGKSISITETTYDLVEAKAYAYKSGLIKAKRQLAEITLREACTQYIEEKRKSRRSPSTIQGYEKIRDTAFQSIMPLKLSSLTPQNIKKAVQFECTKLSRYGKLLSPKTIANAHTFLSSVLREYAPDLEWKVDLPERKPLVPVIIPPDKICPIIAGTEIELPCLLAMWLSLSMSEIRGLTKSKSVRFGQLIISETVVDVRGGAVRKTGGKEDTRTRAFTIPPYIKELIDGVEGDALVPLTRQAIYNRLARLLKKHGLPHISFHRLRHISASVGAALQIGDKEMQERGGWKTDYIMKRVYTHTFDEGRLLADKKMDAYFESIIANKNANEIK